MEAREVKWRWATRDFEAAGKHDSKPLIELLTVRIRVLVGFLTFPLLLFFNSSYLPYLSLHAFSVGVFMDMDGDVL